jgi:hypothetical protein
LSNSAEVVFIDGCQHAGKFNVRVDNLCMAKPTFDPGLTQQFTGAIQRAMLDYVDLYRSTGGGWQQ